MKKTFCAICGAALIATCHADVKLGMLPESDGQRMVLKEFASCAFEKGAFDNDVSLLLPFCWTIPNKGVYTYFSAADQKYSDGISWEMMQIRDGELIHCEYRLNSGAGVWFQPFQLFEIVSSDGTSSFAFHNDHSKKIGSYGAIVDVKWYDLSISTNGVPLKTQMHNGIDSLFANERVKVIRNVVPHRYRGAKAEMVKEPTREQKRLIDCKGRWELSDIAKSRLADMHRKHVESIKPSMVVSNVYIVACDGNFDGEVDAYVSSDVEKESNTNFKWTLYVKDGNGLFARSEKTQSFQFDDIEIISIDSELYAAQDAFFMIDRIGVPSYVMPIIVENGKPELWSYAKHKGVVQSFRQKRGMGNADFSSCIDAGTMGVAKGITSLRDIFLMHSMLVSAKRLQSETIVVSQKGSPE